MRATWCIKLINCSNNFTFQFSALYLFCLRSAHNFSIDHVLCWPATCLKYSHRWISNLICEQSRVENDPSHYQLLHHHHQQRRKHGRRRRPSCEPVCHHHHQRLGKQSLAGIIRGKRGKWKAEVFLKMCSSSSIIGIRTGAESRERKELNFLHLDEFSFFRAAPATPDQEEEEEEPGRQAWERRTLLK